MGAYATCYLGRLEIGSSKNWPDPELLEHFWPQEKVVTTHYRDLPNILAQQYAPEGPMRPVERTSDDLPFMFYRTTAANAIERLEALGYTLPAVSAAFAECIQQELERVTDHAEDYPQLYENDIFIRREQLKLNCWRDALEHLVLHGNSWTASEPTSHAFANTLLKGLQDDSNWYGYPGLDTRIPLRIALEACSPNEDLIYDLSDLLWSECIGLDDDDYEYQDHLTADVTTTASTIVLTEGRFDAFVLAESMKLLYPRLTDLVSFMDFQTFDPEGGAAALVKQVKAFAGARIANKVVALFDNDSAARDAVRALGTTPLPSRFKILHLPRLDLLNAYPTLGPTGELPMDVNEMAASIELFLGTDVLSDPSTGELPRVQWRGYVAGVKQYHGEVSDKRPIQDRFRARLARCAASEESLSEGDWSGIRLILNHILSVFRQEQADEMIRLVRWQYEKGLSRN